MSDDKFEENFNFQEEAIPTAEVEEITPAETAPPEAAVEPGQHLPDAEENKTQNFVPFESKLWHYCWRDSLDEFFWGLVFLAVWAMYFVGQCFGINEQKMVGIPYNILTVIFGIGILYYSIFLFKPFKIFRRKKDGVPDPNANHWCYDLIVFIFFVTSLLVFADRAVMPLTVSKEVKADTEEVKKDKEAETAKPEAEAAKPEAETAKPEAETAKLEAEAAKPEAEAAKPEAEAAKPEAEAAKPEAETAKPETAKPEAETAKPEAETAKPEAETAKPESGDKAEEKSDKPSFLKVTMGVYRQVIYTVLGVFAIGNMVYLIVELFFARVCTYYRLTPVLFIMKTGFFITKERRIAVWDIAQVNMNCNLWQRFLQVGTIELKIHSHGMDGAQISESSLKSNARILYLRGLSDPKGVQDEINHYRLFVRNHMGSRFINSITNDQSAGASDE